MPLTSRLQLPTGLNDGEDLGAPQVSVLGDTGERVGVQGNEILGTGFVAATDFTASVVPGELALEFSSGLVYVGAAREIVLVFDEDGLRVEGVQADGTAIVDDAENWFHLGWDDPDVTGTLRLCWHIDTDNTPPSGYETACSAVFAAGEAISVDNLPTGRANFDETFRSVVEELRDARGSLGSLDARLDVFLNENGTPKASTLDHGGLSGLADDDHPQYLLASGARELAGDLDLDENDLLHVNSIQFGPDNDANWYYGGSGIVQTDNLVTVSRPTDDLSLLAGLVQGDADNRVVVEITGEYRVGDGINPPDCSFGRVAADEWGLGDGDSLAFGIVNGSMLGTTAAQKLGFWGAAPVVQPAHLADADGTLADATTKINAILDLLEATGLMAA